MRWHTSNPIFLQLCTLSKRCVRCLKRQTIQSERPYYHSVETWLVGWLKIWYTHPRDSAPLINCFLTIRHHLLFSNG